MITKWSKDGNSGWTIMFDKLSFKNLFRVSKTDAIKGVSSYFEKNIWILGFKISYVNLNYDDIVCIHIKDSNQYKRCEDSEKINLIKAILKNWAMRGSYFTQHPPFNWNFKCTYDGLETNYEFFLTGDKQWFIDNKLDSLVSPFREITFNDNMKYYPKYNPKHTNIVCDLT
jgi:hypothetical protein